MRTRIGVLTAGTAALALAACSEPTTTDGLLSRAALTGALVTAPAGYGDLSSSYVGDMAEHASGDSAGFHGGHEGRRMGPGMMMGGGLHDAFLGGIGFGPGGRGGPFAGGLGCAGTFSSSSGRVECAPQTLRNGLTVTRSASYRDAAGVVQRAYDSTTTNTVNIRSSVSGTFTFTPPESLFHDGDMHRERGRGGRHGEHGGPLGGPGRLLGDTARIITATIAVNNRSDRTVTGLAAGSTQRTVNGISGGTEQTTGTSSRGEFTATRTIADTTEGVVVPVTTDGRAYPTAGRVVRSMTATLQYSGESPVTLARREVVTYDGSATAKVEITQDGTTKRCTRALPRGPLVCQ